MRLTKQQREEIYNKYDGHCAYCGRKIEYKDMQVDHQIPQARKKWKKISADVIESNDNLFCSCRSCNLYKRANSLETFRRWIEEIPRKLKDVFIYKIGLNYCLIEEKPRKIKFYFEQVEEDKLNQEINK